MDDQDRYTRITLRIPKNLHAQLQAAADATSKSMNAEIIARLQDSFVAESEFHVGSKITHTPIEVDLLKEAAERGAEKAIRGLILIADEAHKAEPASDYGALIRRIFEGLDNSDTTVNYNPPRTPAIPGQNAPKGGSKAPKK